MRDKNEIVTIEMATGDRLRLDTQLADQMEKLGYGRYGYNKLGLGFDLPLNWPADKDLEITFAQLTVLAVKLRMKIIITNLDMVPRKELERKNEGKNGSQLAAENNGKTGELRT